MLSRRSTRLVAFFVLAGILGLGIAGCGDSPPQPGTVQGDAARGLTSFFSNCNICHRDGSTTGPPLAGIADVYLKVCDGDRARARDRFIAYIRDPQGVKPLVPRNGAFTPMPAFGNALTAEQQRQIAEYLLTLTLTSASKSP